MALTFFTLLWDGDFITDGPFFRLTVTYCKSVYKRNSFWLHLFGPNETEVFIHTE